MRARRRGRDRAEAPAPGADREPLGERASRWLDGLSARWRRWLTSERRVSLVVGLLALVSFVVNASTMPSLYDAAVPIALVVSIVQSSTLVWALTRPWFAVGTSTVAVAATAVLTADGDGLPWPVPVVTLVVLAVTVFLLAVREPWPLPASTTVLGVGAGAAGVLPSMSWHPAVWPNVVTTASILVLVGTFGILVRQWLRSRAELVEQQEMTAAAQQRRLLLEERNRIARELHDVVAHGLSVISIQASTLQYRVDGVPPAAVAELDDITESARGALVEMRGLLAVLRQEDADDDLAPQPTLARIPALVESSRRGVETIRLHVRGDLEGQHVAESTTLGAYRIVQEALSNALRHAPGSEVDVRLSVDAERVVIDVENSRPTRAVPPSEGSGFGLLGMRERAAVAGGTLRADTTAAGGFLVHAVLPTQHRAPVPRG